MSYTTLTEVKGYLSISGSGDDALLLDLLGRAEAIIDDYTGRWFEGRVMSRFYDAEGMHIAGRMLLLDADLLTVTEIINGDGSTVGPADILLRPINDPPYFGISLKHESGLHWTHDGSPEGSIRITGTWGYSAAPPPVIAHCALRLAAWLYRQRDTGSDSLDVEVTERGLAVAPARLPADVIQALIPYRRLRIKAA